MWQFLENAALDLKVFAAATMVMARRCEDVWRVMGDGYEGEGRNKRDEGVWEDVGRRGRWNVRFRVGVWVGLGWRVV